MLAFWTDSLVSHSITRLIDCGRLAAVSVGCSTSSSNAGFCAMDSFIMKGSVPRVSKRMIFFPLCRINVDSICFRAVSCRLREELADILLMLVDLSIMQTSVLGLYSENDSQLAPCSKSGLANKKMSESRRKTLKSRGTQWLIFENFESFFLAFRRNCMAAQDCFLCRKRLRRCIIIGAKIRHSPNKATG